MKTKRMLKLNFDTINVKKKLRSLKNPYHLTTIQNRFFSGHALDQMQNRGLTPTVIEETIKTGSYSKGKNPGTMAYYDSVNNVTVVLNNESKVISVSYEDFNQ